MTGQLENTAVAPATTQTVAKGHPLGFWFFFWGEFAERCSYYGMKAILPFYLTAILLFTDTQGGQYMNWFKTAVYTLPLLGGFLADRFFGKYWTIVGFSIPYVAGHFILGIPNNVALVIALCLLAGGSGVIKPNISTLMGMTYDQKRPGQEQLRASAFLWFYFSINIGSTISMFALPLIVAYYGSTQHAYAIAFQVPAWLMVGALLVFASGKPHYGKEIRSYQKPTPEENRQRRQTLINLAGVFGLILFFWVPYEFNDNIWMYFSRDYVNLDINQLGSRFAGYWTALHLPQVVPTAQLQVINPLCVIIFAPLFASLFARLDPKARVFTAGNKMFAGFVCSVAASATMAAAGFLVKAHAVPFFVGSSVDWVWVVDPQSKLSIAWPSVAFVFLTLGEILIYGTGLEYAYAAAPKNMKSFVTACFLALDAGANFIDSFLVSLYGGSLNAAARGPMSAGAFFSMATLIILVAAVAFLFMARKMNRQMQSESAS
jgi:dipeptide/tripeptide permease